MTEDADLSKRSGSDVYPEKRTKVPVVWIVPIVAALVRRRDRRSSGT